MDDLSQIIAENVLDVDVTDSAYMDMLMVRLDEIQIENEEFMELLVSRLNDMVITWVQPWYQQGNCLTRPLKENVLNNGEMFRTDSFCTMEDKRIAKNWRKFRKMFELPDKPICLARWKNKSKSRSPITPEEKARHFFVSFIAKGLKRTLYQVYKHFITMYGAPVRGPFSPTEEKIMEICFHHDPKNAVRYLSALLGRESRGIYKRLHNMQNGTPEKKEKIKWTLSKATKFLKRLMKYSGCSLEELQNKQIETSIWLKIEEKMGIPTAKLQRFWFEYLHIQLFVKCDVKINRLRKKIIKILMTMPSYKVWTDIRWAEVAKHLPAGFTPKFLNVVIYNLIKSFGTILNTPLPEILSYALQKLKTASAKYSGKRLKTLVLNDQGKLEPIKYDVKLHLKVSGNE